MGFAKLDLSWIPELVGQKCTLKRPESTDFYELGKNDLIPEKSENRHE